MQYEQGDKVGAELSVLLSLTPFLSKFGIKVPKADADNLSKKFINAKTTSDVDLIISNLSKPELNTLKSLRELGDINKITSMVNDPQVKSAIAAYESSMQTAGANAGNGDAASIAAATAYLAAYAGATINDKQAVSALSAVVYGYYYATQYSGNFKTFFNALVVDFATKVSAFLSKLMVI